MSRILQIPEIEGLLLSAELNSQPSRGCEDEEEKELIPAVTIEGVGRFLLVKRPGIRGQNPMTGEEVVIPEKVLIKFEADDAILEKLNRS